MGCILFLFFLGFTKYTAFLWPTKSEPLLGKCINFNISGRENSYRLQKISKPGERAYKLCKLSIWVSVKINDKHLPCSWGKGTTKYFNIYPIHIIWVYVGIYSVNNTIYTCMSHFQVEKDNYFMHMELPT